MTRAVWLGMFGVLVLVGARAEAQALRVDRSAQTMRVDGALGDWKGARFTGLGEGADAAVRYALASVDDGLYIGAEVSDETLVRKNGVGPTQDALVLTLAMPDAAGKWQVSEVWLHPGEPARTKAAAGISGAGQAPRQEPLIKVVEGPRAEGAGYVIEAYVPWSLIRGAEIWEQGRARLRFEDVDKAARPTVETTLSSASRLKPHELPRIALGVGHNDFLGAFASSKGLTGTEPRFDLRGNVSGDATVERVVILDKFVLVYGKGYKRGETYGYFALPFGTGGGIGSAELLDVTNDGASELLVRVRQRNNLGARELLVVLSLAEESISPLLSIELKKETKGGFIESTLSVDKKAKPVRIRVALGRAVGLDALTYQEAPASDAEPILLPWGDVLAREYAHDGKKLGLVVEDKRAPEMPSKELTESAKATSAEAPRATAAELVTATPSALVAQFKRDHKLSPGVSPDRTLSADLTGGPAQEQIYAFGTKLMMFGPDIGDGAAYVLYGLPIAGPEELLYLGAADVTGDGKREVFVRIRQPLSGASPSAPAVHREVLLLLRLDVSATRAQVVRLLSAEVVRRMGPDAVINRVRVQGGKLTIEPGSPSGFTQATYPFTDEATGGVERLLLPWLDQPVRYRFDGSRLSPE